MELVDQVSRAVLLIGWLALGEVPTLLQVTGLIIVLFGFRLTQRERKNDLPPSTAAAADSN